MCCFYLIDKLLIDKMIKNNITLSLSTAKIEKKYELCK